MERTEIYGNDYTITPNDKSGVQQTLRGIWDHTSGGEFEGSFMIRAVVKNNLENTEVLINESQLYVNITDPCILASSIVAPVSVTPITYVINGNPAAETSTIAYFHD